MRKSEEQRIQGKEIVKNKMTDCALTNAVGHFSLIKTEEIIRSLSYKNPFCAIVKGLRLFKASEEQIPTAMSEETTKRVNYHKNGNLPMFCIEKDIRGGVLYAPFACAKMVYPTGFLRSQSVKSCCKEIKNSNKPPRRSLSRDGVANNRFIGCLVG